MACVECLLFTQPYTRDLRVGKDHPGHRAIVIVAISLCDRVSRRDLGTIGRHVDELVAISHIASGIHTGARGLHVLPHNDPPATVSLHFQLLKTQIFGIGTPTGGENNSLGGYFLYGTVLNDLQGNAIL